MTSVIVSVSLDMILKPTILPSYVLPIPSLFTGFVASSVAHCKGKSAAFEEAKCGLKRTSCGAEAIPMMKTKPTPASPFSSALYWI